ncbi:MAG: DUF4097 family beta strand repeat protein [Gemmatimonadota bacterium]|nr:MAG: DUF4097 family beta strand repeat protein [Gemmatimonadota bacterium]
MSLRMLAAAVLLGPLALTSAELSAQDFEWQGRLQQGQTIEIVGVLGDVVADASGASGVEVTAELRERRRGRAEDIEFEIIEHDAGVTICALYPTPRRADRPNECRPNGRSRNNTQDNDVSVHFTVHVPAGVNLVARTVNGEIEAASLSGDVEAHTVNGDVDISTTGFAQATTVNGSIRAELGRADWSGSVEFETVNGSITVVLPEGLDADVTAKTVNGGIETDFPLMVRGRFSSKSISGTIGDGGRRLWLQTVNGSLRLLKR